MGFLKKIFKKQEEEPILKGLEEFPPLNLEKLHQNIDPELYNEGKMPIPVKKSNPDAES